MAADLERLAQEFQDPKYAEFRASLMAKAQEARQLGAPEHFDTSIATATPKETIPVEIRRFTDEAKEALAKEGFVIRELTGQSIASERAAGRKFWSTWHRDYPQFEALTSMQSEVAIKPGKLFIPRSNNKTLAQQEEMIGGFSQRLGETVPGVDAIMGEAPDYVDLVFTHLGATGEYLFGEKDGYNYARTKTPTVGTHVANVGLASPGNGLDVDYRLRGYGYSYVYAAPLVVPKA